MPPILTFQPETKRCGRVVGLSKVEYKVRSGKAKVSPWRDFPLRCKTHLLIADIQKHHHGPSIIRFSSCRYLFRTVISQDPSTYMLQ